MKQFLLKFSFLQHKKNMFITWTCFRNGENWQMLITHLRTLSVLLEQPYDDQCENAEK